VISKVSTNWWLHPSDICQWISWLQGGWFVANGRDKSTNPIS